jgi:hypothetical protein
LRTFPKECIVNPLLICNGFCNGSTILKLSSNTRWCCYANKATKQLCVADALQDWQ